MKVGSEGKWRRGREKEERRFRVTDMMMIMINTDCGRRHTRHTNLPAKKHTPAHTPHPFAWPAWLHTRTLCLPQWGSYLTTHTPQARADMQSLCGHRRYCTNIQVQSFADETSQISVMCVKLICEIKTDLSQSCNHCGVSWVVSGSQLNFGWYLVTVPLCERERAGGSRKWKRRKEGQRLLSIQLMRFPPVLAPPSSSSWPGNWSRFAIGGAWRDEPQVYPLWTFFNGQQHPDVCNDWSADLIGQ